MSDEEFYFLEYRKCSERYGRLPRHDKRKRRFYNLLGASMLAAYVEELRKFSQE